LLLSLRSLVESIDDALVKDTNKLAVLVLDDADGEDAAEDGSETIGNSAEKTSSKTADDVERDANHAAGDTADDVSGNVAQGTAETPLWVGNREGGRYAEESGREEGELHFEV
jgi:hypothetical protein